MLTTVDRSKLMAGYKRSADSKHRIEEALAHKGLTPRADDLVIRALEKAEIFIAARTWQRFWDGENIRRPTFINICEWLAIPYRDVVAPSQLGVEVARLPPDLVPSDPVPADSDPFYGRVTELIELESWVANPNCRMITVHGFDGMGKSSLVRKLRDRVRAHFQHIEWKTFSYGDSIESTLIHLLQQLDAGDSASDLSSDRIKDRFWQLLQQHRYLIVLEQIQDGRTGRYEDYLDLLAQLVETYNGKYHLSCILLITSFERPNGLTDLANHRDSVKRWHLKGVDNAAGLDILRNRNPNLLIDAKSAAELVTLFDGYPAALRHVSSHIQEHHDGNVRKFLNNPSIPKKIETILKQLTDDLDLPARTILGILTDADRSISQAQLREIYRNQIHDLCDFTTAINVLLRRSLLVRAEGDSDYGKTYFYSLEQLVCRYLSQKTSS